MIKEKFSWLESFENIRNFPLILWNDSLFPMRRFTRFFLLLIVFSLSSCRGPSPEYYQEKGRQITAELIEQVRHIETIEELIQRDACLTALYNELVDLIIEAKTYQRKHHKTWEPDEESSLISDELQFELMRLYKIPGAKQLMEKYQLPALIRLDAFEKKEQKRRKR